MWATGDVTGTAAVGGVVGTNGQGLFNAWSSSAVSGQSRVGGVAGENSSLVSRTIARGPVTGVSEVGGLVGRDAGGMFSLVQHSFFDTEATGRLTTAGGSGAVGRSPAQMKDPATFHALEGHMVWQLSAGTYPALRDVNAPCTAGAAAFDGGDGTAANPFRISTTEQLYAVTCNGSASFLLTADLDFANQPATPPLSGALSQNDPVTGSTAFGAAFDGSFDGGSHTISNWTYAGGKAGFFGRLRGTTKNLTLANVDVVGGYNVGALAANIEGQLEHVAASGAVRGMYAVGGLVGSSETGSQIRRSSASTDVFIVGSYGGGLAGFYDGLIEDSYATGTVTSSSACVGGFAGHGGGTIRRAYAAGAVSAGSGVGFACTSGSIIAALWNVETTGQSLSGSSAAHDVRGLTSAEMKTQESFPTWDFETTWQLVPESFPSLR